MSKNIDTQDDNLSPFSRKKKIYEKRDLSNSLEEKQEEINHRVVEVEIEDQELEKTEPEEPKQDLDSKLEDTDFNEVDNANISEEKTPENLPKKSNILSKIGTFIKNHKKQIRLALLTLFLLGVFGATATGLWLIQRYNSLGDVVSQATSIDEGSIVYDKNNKEIYRYNSDGRQREIVDIKDIPEEMKGSIIGLEDENFYENPVGIPWQNLVGATLQCFISSGNNCRGGSGLSQQLIKNVTSDDSRTYGRKINELLLAIKFNREIGSTDQERQDKVLESYLNWVSFGRNTYGVQAASKSYFGKSVNDKLTLPESCYLASMVQRPSTFSEAIEIEIKNRQTPETKTPNPNWDTLEARKNACLEKHFRLNLKNRGGERFIKNENELKELQAQKVEFKPKPKTEQPYGHLQNYITEQLISNLDINETQLSTKGYRIYTTFDLDIQNKAQEIIQTTAQERIIDNGGNNAASVILDGPSGEVVAMIGSRDFNDESILGQVNVATSPRQPGSSFKPYVYASAFNNGFNPGTVLTDVSTDFGNYRPANFSRTTRGVTNIRSSLADSLNIPAVKSVYLSQENGSNPNGVGGINNVLNLAESAGVKLPYKDNCINVATSLGTCEVTALSHAAGINTLLHDGNYKAPKIFKKIILKDRFDNQETDVLANSNVPAYKDKDAAIDPLAARQIANVMSDYGARSVGTWGNERKILQLDDWTGDNQVAAKTGTTSDVKDTWTVGGSPLYTVVVWAGNTDGKPMDSTALSTQTAGKTWQDIMVYLHTDKTKVGFSKEGLIATGLDPNTGLLGSGKTELLTPDQISILKKAEQNLNDPSYDPTQNSIIQNRTPVVSRKLNINKLDGKILPKLAPGQTPYPVELVEEKVCTQVISEFPRIASWFDPAKGLQQRLTNATPCPTESSSLDLTKEGPNITTNLDKTKSIPLIIKIQAKSKLETATIKTLSFNIGGVEIQKVENTGVLEIDLSELKDQAGTKDVIIKATDSLGLSSELVIEGINFSNKTSNSSSSKSSSSNSSKSSSSNSSSSAFSSTSSSSSNSSI